MKDKNVSNQRQERFLEHVKSLRLEFPVAEIVEKTGYTKGVVSTYLNGKGVVSQNFYNTFLEAYNLKQADEQLIAKQSQSFTEPEKPARKGIAYEPLTQEDLQRIKRENSDEDDDDFPPFNRTRTGLSATGQSEGERIRYEKATGNNKEDEGLIVVPIRAQAGYSQSVLDPLYFRDFRRMHIPDMPYKGDKFRVFEVEGDSMEPTLKQYYLLITERVEPYDWDNIANFYIYVIVTVDKLMIKRLYKKDKDRFVAISDNKDFYPQFMIQKKDIKELWVVKRKVDWEMPPPVKFDIEI